MDAEPSGRTGPKLSGDGWQRIRSDAGNDLALLCEAQSHPSPESRLSVYKQTLTTGSIK